MLMTLLLNYTARPLAVKKKFNRRGRKDTENAKYNFPFRSPTPLPDHANHQFLSSPSLWIYGDGFFPVVDRHH